MSDKALSRLELEFTQKMQTHFPAGEIDPEVLRLWSGCPKEILSKVLLKTFKNPPTGINKNLFSKTITKNIFLDSPEGVDFWHKKGHIIFTDPEFRTLFSMERKNALQSHGRTCVGVYEMTVSATSEHIFNMFSPHLEDLCVEPSQILYFIKKAKEGLGEVTNRVVLFLLYAEEVDAFFVADVRINHSQHGTNYIAEIIIRALREQSLVWDKKNKPCVVVSEK